MEELYQVIWMSLTVFVLVFLLSRLVGRKLLSQMTYFDFVIAIVLGTIAGSFVVNEVKGMWVLVGPVVITLATVATAFLSLRNLAARKLLQGEPVIVVHNGKILEDNMLKLRYDLDDLEMQLRNNGVFNITKVEFAVLEPNGKLSVLKKSQHQPATRSDLGEASGYEGMATEIIKDGDVIQQNLEQSNLDYSWLFSKLQQQGIQDPAEVFYAVLQSDGTLYIDRRKDQLTNVQKVED